METPPTLAYMLVSLVVRRAGTLSDARGRKTHAATMTPVRRHASRCAMRLSVADLKRSARRGGGGGKVQIIPILLFLPFPLKILKSFLPHLEKNTGRKEGTPQAPPPPPPRPSPIPLPCPLPRKEQGAATAPRFLHVPLMPLCFQQTVVQIKDSNILCL